MHLVLNKCLQMSFTFVYKGHLETFIQN